MDLFLGIDIGTFEAKGVLVSAAGEVVASAARKHRMLVPEPGFAEHRSVEDWWDGFTTLSRQLIADAGVAPSQIKAVGTSAIGPCMLPLDADGAPLMNAVLYGVDARARREIDELTAGIGEERIHAVCGNVLTTQSVGPKILWLKRNRPDLFARTRTIVSSTPDLVRRLTGEIVIDHYSAANFSPFYDVSSQAWRFDLAPGLVDETMLPRPVWTTDVVGGVTAAAAEATGLLPGTPVIAGTIDAAAEAVSTGVIGPGEMMLMYGSSIFIIEVTAARVADPRLWYAPWLFPGEHAAMAGLATSGTITHWFRDQIARDLDPATAMPQLAAEAAQSPAGAKGLVLLPYFSGAQTPLYDPTARGMLFGLDLTHTRADMMRAVLEGVAYATRHILDTFREAGADPHTLYAVGGGTRNAPWIQAMSDILERPQTVRAKGFGASYGDAFLAALAVGAVKAGDITAWNAVDRHIAPDAATRTVYRTGYEVFRALHPATRALMARLGG